MKIYRDSVIGGNAKLVRSINRSTILNIIREHQPITRVKISKLMGLNKSTITRIVNDLLEENFIYEEIWKDQNVGRNPIALRLKKNIHYVGAVNIDHKTTQIAVFDIDGSKVKALKIKTKIKNPVDYFELCAKKLKELQEELRILKLEGIGVNLAGIVDSSRELIIASVSLGVKNFNVGKIFRKYFPDVPNIKFENSANSAALAELWFGKGRTKNMDNFVFLWVGIGIGAGIIIDKKLWKGNYYSAGEFGHMKIFGTSNSKKYKISDNFGANASDLATIKRYNQLENEFNKRNNVTDMDTIITKAKANNPNAINALKKTGCYLGIGISNIITTIDPKAIVIGGKLIEVWDIIYPEIIKTLEKYIYQFIEHEISIYPKSSKINSILLGAAILPIMEIFNDYSITR